jgi:hypothetical protein
MIIRALLLKRSQLIPRHRRARTPIAIRQASATLTAEPLIQEPRNLVIHGITLPLTNAMNNIPTTLTNQPLEHQPTRAQRR